MWADIALGNYHPVFPAARETQMTHRTFLVALVARSESANIAFEVAILRRLLQWWGLVCHYVFSFVNTISIFMRQIYDIIARTLFLFSVLYLNGPVI
jgi:hypothetical protein